GRTSQIVPKCVPHMRRSPASASEISDHSSGRLEYLEYDSKSFLFGAGDVTKATPRKAAQHQKVVATERSSRRSRLLSLRPIELPASRDPLGRVLLVQLRFPQEYPHPPTLQSQRDGVPAVTRAAPTLLRAPDQATSPKRKPKRHRRVPTDPGDRCPVSPVHS